jgi:hypothetical protein
MATKQVKKRGRRWSPYAFREIEADHKGSLRAFLSFIYRRHKDPRGYWSDLSQVLFLLSLEEIRKQSDEQYGLLVSSLRPGDLDWLQTKAKAWFEGMMADLREGGEWEAKDYVWRIQKTRLVSGEEIFWYAPVVPEFKDREDLYDELRSLVAWDLMYLKVAALPRCAECRECFLRLDKRPARFCSQRCRYRNYDREKRGSPSRRKKARKKG